jgi:hypothetical protein
LKEIALLARIHRVVIDDQASPPHPELSISVSGCPRIGASGKIACARPGRGIPVPASCNPRVPASCNPDRRARRYTRSCGGCDDGRPVGWEGHIPRSRVETLATRPSPRRPEGVETMLRGRTAGNSAFDCHVSRSEASTVSERRR